MAPIPVAKLALSPADAPAKSALRELNGSLYLLAANKSKEPQSVRFSGAPLSGRQEVSYETHSAAVEANMLADDFSSFGVHLYESDKR